MCYSKMCKKFLQVPIKNLMLQVLADLQNNVNIAVNCRENMLKSNITVTNVRFIVVVYGMQSWNLLNAPRNICCKVIIINCTNKLSLLNELLYLLGLYRIFYLYSIQFEQQAEQCIHIGPNSGARNRPNANIQLCAVIPFQSARKRQFLEGLMFYT